MIHRRRFLADTTHTLLAAGVTGMTGSSPGAERQRPAGDSEPLPIVDTHQHLWDLSKLRLPWLENAGKLNRSFVMKDYVEATEGLNVLKAVYMEVAVADDMKLAEAEWIVEICRRKDNPTCGAVIGGMPASDGFRAYIPRFKGSPYVKGVRQILSGPAAKAGLWQTDTFRRAIRLLGALGMSFDLCMAPTELPAAAKLVDACPDTRFILDHCGNADPKDRGEGYQQWRRDIAVLAKRKNVVCKISGIIARADPESWTAGELAPIVNHCLEVFGPDRVMFANDWPVCTRTASLRQWAEALKVIVRNRPESERRKLFAENAIKFYDLE